MSPALILPAKYERERERSTRSASNWEAWTPTPSLSGIAVSPETALSLTAVYACVNVIAANVASLPFEVFKRIGDGGREPDWDHHVYDLIAIEPNEEMSAFDFWQAIVGSAVLRGNGYAEIERNRAGKPIALHLLDAEFVAVRRDGAGRLYYQIGPDPRSGIMDTRRLLPENVLHVKGLSPNGIVGYNPISLARESIGGFIAAEKSASSAFGQSSVPLGMIEVPGEATPEARKNFREGWNSQHQGPYNSHKVAILEDGWKFVPLKLPLADLQYLENRKFTPQEIARLFGVPPHKIGDLSEATYSNIEEQNLDFGMGTLRLWCERVESETNRKLFFRHERRKYFCQHNMNSLMRGNSQAQADSLTKLFAMAGVSVNDVCRETGKNPIGPAGDVRFVAANLVRLESKPDVDPTKLPEVPTPTADPVPDPIETDDPAEEPEAEPKANAEVVSSLRSLVRDAIGRCVRKEINGLRRAAKRPDFVGFADGFYQRHRETMRSILVPSLRALDSATGDIVGPEDYPDVFASVALAEIRKGGDPASILARWESSKVDEMMGALP